MLDIPTETSLKFLSLQIQGVFRPPKETPILQYSLGLEHISVGQENPS